VCVCVKDNTYWRHLFTGKAAKFLGKLGQKLAGKLAVKEDGHDPQVGRRDGSFTRGGGAARLGGYGAAPLTGDDDEDSHESATGGRGASGGLTKVKALVTSVDGSVWVGYKHGQLEKYTFAGRLLLRKVGATFRD
jgi:hypothetical protein